MMKLRQKFIGYVFGGVAMLSSCSPSPDLSSLVKDMVVQTGFDNSADFSRYSTYAMPVDTIGQIYNLAPQDTIIVGDYAKLVSGTVKDNLDRAGYTQVALNQNPDLGINVYVVRNYRVYQSYISPGYYGPGFGYYNYYPYSGYYYAPYVTYSSSNTATLIMEMLDLKNKDSKGRIRMIWTAHIGDVVTSYDSYQKSAEGINQAFLQSSYIRK